MTKLRPLLLAPLLVLLASTAARAEWFTLAGTPGDDNSDYIQIDPTSIQSDGVKRTLDLRVSRNAVRTSTDGIQFRSFEGAAEVDCSSKTARFTRSTFFPEPHFTGSPVARLTYTSEQPRPVAFRLFRNDYAPRLISAACSIGAGPSPSGDIKIRN